MVKLVVIVGSNSSKVSSVIMLVYYVFGVCLCCVVKVISSVLKNGVRMVRSRVMVYYVKDYYCYVVIGLGLM